VSPPPEPQQVRSETILIEADLVLDHGGDRNDGRRIRSSALLVEA
jgi:hypothetical protein